MSRNITPSWSRGVVRRRGRARDGRSAVHGWQGPSADRAAPVCASSCSIAFWAVMSWSWAKKYCGSPAASRTRVTWVDAHTDDPIRADVASLLLIGVSGLRRQVPSRPSLTGSRQDGRSPRAAADQLLSDLPRNSQRAVLTRVGRPFEVCDDDTHGGLLETDLVIGFVAVASPVCVVLLSGIEHRPGGTFDSANGVALR